jgi:hypothetical protein
VNVDAEDFRRHYSALSDAALLELDPDELVEAARQCYEIELAQRGLRREKKAAPESPLEAELVPVGEYTLFQEAELARMILESADIPCRLDNTYDPYGQKVLADPAFGRLRLLVPVNLLEDARECLAASVPDTISEEELAKQAEAAADLETGEDGESPRI